MNFKLDHVIYYTKDANDMKELLIQNTNLHPVFGGRHDNWGTYNTLLHFDLSYIEFLSVEDVEQFTQYNKENVGFTLMSSIYNSDYREGFHNIAFRTHTIEQDAEYFRNLGLEVDGPVSFNRVKSNGQSVEWKLLFIKSRDSQLQLPFIIDWEVSDTKRMNQLVEDGNISQDDGEIETINIWCCDAKHTAQLWSELFQLDLENHEATYILHLPNCTLKFYESEQSKIFMIETTHYTFTE